jgi:GR25 family glycosyltransferase involved in LPS biosynthesis
MDIVPTIRKYLQVENVSVFQGINQSEAMSIYHNLPLYTKYTMKTGRSDHMQIANPSMLGCLLSHITIWENIHKNEIVLILEEDAYVNLHSSLIMKHLSSDMNNIEWDVIMLESGQFIASGNWVTVGNHAATCAESNQTVNICTWFGTRGYLITYVGAQKLLAHSFPVHVQIDAYMGLLAAFDPEFKMFWTRNNVVHQKLLHISKVWDGCLKCYMPKTNIFYVFVVLVFFYNVYLCLKKFVCNSLSMNGNCI